jgi:hypothetical protein
LPRVPIHGVVSAGTAIVSVEQDGIYIGRRLVPTLGGAREIIVSPVFDEEDFDSGEETNLQIPRQLIIARNAL